MDLQKQQVKIGIYAGTFDPVHAGHIGFALQAIQEADLSEVYFLPERRPRSKPGAEHYEHRVAMLKRALKPHEALNIIELVDKQFRINRTLPQLMKTFQHAQLVLLMGADVFVNVPDWPNVKQLTTTCHFVVSVRGQSELAAINATIAHLQLTPSQVSIMDSARPEVSSSQIRGALRQHNFSVAGLLPSVTRYVAREWLYVRVPREQNS